jgi:hypothetical protein
MLTTTCMSISIQPISYTATAYIGTNGILTVVGTSIYIQSTFINIGAVTSISVQRVTTITATYVRFRSVVAILSTFVASIKALIDVCI